MIPLYVEVAALRHVNTTWGMMSQAMRMGSVESKHLRLKCSKIELRCSYHTYKCRKLTEWFVLPLRDSQRKNLLRDEHKGCTKNRNKPTK